MITAREVRATAEASGFRPETVEKVLRLNGILGRLDEHPLTRAAWVLKGGTALNLLHLDVPRLSVDIDLNFTGAADLKGMQAARPDFDRAVSSVCEREGCSVKRAPGEHAGGKFRLRFASVLGGSQNLEVDVSYVARVPLLGSDRRRVRFPSTSELNVPTLTLEELAAGKFTALLHRSAARDAFDAANLLELAPDLFERPAFRLAFVCFMGMAREDVRSVRGPPRALSLRDVDTQLEPMLRRGAEGGGRSGAELLQWIETSLQRATATLLDWADGERRFLDRLLDDGEIDAEHLTSDPALQDRVRTQPMLRWKAVRVREREGS